MSKYLISAIVLAAAQLSLAAAEPAANQDASPPATCPEMQDGHPMYQSGGQAAMQQHMGDGSMAGSGHMMQQGNGGMMGSGMPHGGNAGAMQGQMMQQGGQAGMGHGDHQGMMQGNGQCPALNQPDQGK